MSRLLLPGRKLFMPPARARGTVLVSSPRWIHPAAAGGPTSCNITYAGFGQASLVASGGTAALTPGGVAGDIALCVVNANEAISSISSGWTQIGNLTAGNSTAGYCGVWYRRMVSGDSAPVITTASGGYFDAICAGFRGCIASGSPIDANSTDWTIGSNGSSKILAVPGITTATNYDLVVMLMALYAYFPNDTLTYNNGFSATLSWGDYNNRNEFFAGSQVLATAGATGSTNLTSGHLVSTFSSGFTLALKTS